MTQRERRLLAAAAAFAGGAVLVYFVGPEPVRRLQRVVADQAREQSRHLEENLREVKATLSSLEHQLQEAAQELTGRLEEIRRHTLEQHLPGTQLDPEDWTLTRTDVDHDLRRLPGH